MNTVNTGVPSLAPNQSIASTSQAIGGMPMSTVTSGRAIIEAVMETPAASPSTLPTATDRAKPSSARRLVASSSGQAAPSSISWSRREKVSSGAGSTSAP